MNDSTNPTGTPTVHKHPEIGPAQSPQVPSLPASPTPTIGANGQSAPASSASALLTKPLTVPYQFAAIPAGLQQLPQWVCWRYVRDPEKVKWNKVPFHPSTNRKASVTDPTTWSSFAEAVQFSPYYDGIGFVLVEGNGLVIIDLDDKPSAPASDSDIKFFTEVIVNFATYTERSVGGHGVHIVAVGALPDGLKGRRTGHVEVYAAERYLTFSGNTNLDGLRFVPPGIETVWEVEPCQKEINLLLGKLAGSVVGHRGWMDITDDPQQRRSDDAVMSSALNADNSAKFKALFYGDWTAIGHRNHSDADMQLLTMLAFHSKNNEQCLRIYGFSALHPSRRTDKKKHHTYPGRTMDKARAYDNARIQADLEKHPPIQFSIDVEASNKAHQDRLNYYNSLSERFVALNTLK